MDFILAVDSKILTYIAEHVHSDFLTTLLRIITSLGDNGLIWIIIAVLLLIRPSTRRWGICILAGLVVGVILTENILKPLFARPRPFMLFEHITPLIHAPTSFSLPSGHTTSSFIAATALFRMNKKAGAAGYLLAGAISFSRMYLCVHYPSDVFASILLGIGVSLAVSAITNRVIDKLHYSRLR